MRSCLKEIVPKKGKEEEEEKEEEERKGKRGGGRGGGGALSRDLKKIDLFLEKGVKSNLCYIWLKPVGCVRT